MTLIPQAPPWKVFCQESGDGDGQPDNEESADNSNV